MYLCFHDIVRCYQMLLLEFKKLIQIISPSPFPIWWLYIDTCTGCVISLGEDGQRRGILLRRGKSGSELLRREGGVRVVDHAHH